METIISLFVDLITDPIKEYVVTPIKRHVSYAFTCDSNVDRLQDDVQKLQNKRVRLQKSVAGATRNGKKIHTNVNEWLDTAEIDIEEAKKLIQGKEEAKNKCFVGFCPNLKTRYQLSKKADKKALAKDEQLQNAEGLDPIAFTPSPEPIIEPSLYSQEALPSRVLILDQIMNALKDAKLNIIGVYGMGGIGKSTLAKEVQRKAVEKKLFETVVLVAVSETPEIRRIQGEIADSLGLELTAEQVTGRTSQLYKRLKEVKVLIILDDVWQKLDLSTVGIPLGEGCKILITSRKKDVLSKEMRTQKEFALNVLEKEETWKLFEISVSNGIDPELQAIAAEVAEKCAGLPLLILKVATDLQNKASYAWTDMLNKLSSVENKKIYEKVYTVIESSYEQLPEEDAKSLFLLCAVFGNSNIRIHDLFVYCAGLALFKDIHSLEGARNRVLTTIDLLKDECLLLNGDMAGFVKIHDVVCKIALAISVKVQPTFVGTREVRSTDLQNNDYTRISLPYCDFLELPEVLECPEAELFSMFTDDGYLGLQNSFFERVAKLKILNLYGVTFRHGLPTSLNFLTGLQALSLNECLFRDVDMIAELKQLELLSFADSILIEELPSEMKALTRLKLLDLRGCYKLKTIHPNVISNMCSLEELYVFTSFTGWGEIGQASLVELKNLSRLATLEIQVKDEKFLPVF